MTTYIKDLIDLPEKVHGGDFVLKLTEGIGVSLVEHLKGAVNGQVTPEAMELIRGEILKTTNPAQLLGGGPLLGVNGVSIIGHGSGRADAVQRAIGTAEFAVNNGFIAKINEELSQIRELMED